MRGVTSVLAVLALLLACAMAYTPRALEDKIDSLPGQPTEGVDFDIFSGYIDVRNGTRSIFYMFFTSSKGYENSPTVWTTSGGPGCSGMYFNFIETGAFYPIDKGEALALRPTRINKMVNSIYVEQPAGVGFSIDSGRTAWTDKEAAEDNFEFILNFLQRFPEIAKNEFFLNSESYGGHYLPTLAVEFMNNEHDVNFKGFLVGNPLVYMPLRDYGEYYTYGANMLLPYAEFEEYKAKCKPDTVDTPNPPKPIPGICRTLESTFNQATRLVDPYALNYPLCLDRNGVFQSKVAGDVTLHTINMYRKAMGKEPVYPRYNNMSPNVQRILKSIGFTEFETELGGFNPDYNPCEESWTNVYFNRKDVQATLKVSPKSNSRWSTCASINYSNYDMITSMIPVYEALMKNTDYRMVIMSGDNDAICPAYESLSMLDGGLVAADNWTPWTLKKDGQLNGYKRTYTAKGAKVPLVFTTVRSAGHMVPTTNPDAFYQIFEKFIEGTF